MYILYVQEHPSVPVVPIEEDGSVPSTVVIGVVWLAPRENGAVDGRGVLPVSGDSAVETPLETTKTHSRTIPHTFQVT